ncbi:EF-hand domain-containing family member B [Spea bombifrons]|uniref:EF-hand domain-containing family member B n=1 Tax=Spea bombifrons TaxID=233779 RepID=UPI00234AB789|nr:EF-hand domain-containing family member B [Spea bombifrons]
MMDRVPVYQGRFTDRSPGVRSAGKLLPIGDRAPTCLTERYPSAPPVVQKFLNFRRPDPGVRTIFYGKAYDPYFEKDMTHGVKNHYLLSAGSLINSQPITLFQQKLLEKRESVYSSRKQAPLGKSHDQSKAVPAYIDINERTFGRKYKRGMTVGGLINPRKTFDELDEESKKGHELYVVTHNDYNVGEIKDRQYDLTKFKKDRRFGIETPHFSDGRTTRQTIQWLQNKNKEGAVIISKRLHDFKERTQPQIGKVLDPNADTRNLPADHTFGLPVRAAQNGLQRPRWAAKTTSEFRSLKTSPLGVHY